MDFQILGPLEVRGEQGVVALEGLKPRAVLAVLLLHRNEPVSAERLAVALWGEDAPVGATKTVQVHVSRLRKALGDPEAVATTPAGYRLRVRPEELDADRFEHGVDAGRRALRAGSPERASALLQEALGMWRGPPLAELEFEPFAQPEIARLEEQRLAAIEARVEADLGAGRHAALVSELRQLLAEHPTRERLAAHLMLALYRCGRQAEALEVYREARGVLVAQVGIEPGPELRRLHEAVLSQAPSLELPGPAGEVSRALDAGASPLAGRDAELATLRTHWEAARSGAGRVVTVEGIEGIGKTRLAAELARDARSGGADVRYLGARDPAGAVLARLGELEDIARPTLVVLDDVDRAPTEVLTALAGLGQALTSAPVLVLVTARNGSALRRVPADDALELAPLDAEAVRAIAGPEAPTAWLLEAGGVPRRVHRLLSRWAREDAERRVDVGAGRTAAGRAELQSIEAALADDVRELQVAQERTRSAREHDGPVPCPFKGLAAFDVADAPYFFGRERLVAELVARLVGASLLGVVGPSGSGKSSVVRAGLLPALADGVLPGSADWVRVVMRPGEHPLRELAHATADIGNGRPMMLVVDQFEETFTACRDEQERAAFVAELVATDRPRRVVVLAIRVDYYGRCATYPRLSSLLGSHHVLVGAMRRDELRRAVERPALRAGLQVEPELTDALLGDVEYEPGALPTLSTALLELWQRRDGRTLRLSTYEATGGVRSAVARHAEDAFGGLDPAQQTVARSVLLRLAAEGADGTVERRRVPLAEFTAGEDAAGVVALLADQRLLTISSGAVEVAHEALLREWPRLRGWLEEDADGRRLHRRLADAAREWDAAGRDTGDLYRGARLASAVEWRARHDPELNHTERAYLDASHSAHQREHARRRRAVASALAVLVTIAGIATIVAVRDVQRARYEQRAAASRVLATRALAHLEDNLTLAALLGLEAYRREPTSEARNAVLSVLPALAGYRRIGAPLEHGTPVESIAISPDGRTLAAGADDGRIWLWDTASQRLIGRLTGPRKQINDVAISPNGRLLASASDDATVRLWDLKTRTRRGRPLAQHAHTATAVAFSPDSTILASGQGGPRSTPVDKQHATVRFWDVASGRALGRPLDTGATAINNVQFSPDGAQLAIAGDGFMSLWDRATRRRLWHSDAGDTIALSRDGRTLASLGSDPQLWDLRTRRPLGRPLDGHGAVSVMAFSPDGRTLASGGQDATVRLWNVATHRPLSVLVTDTHPEGPDHVAGVLDVAFSPRGGLLASADEAGTVQLWKTDVGHPLSRPLRGGRDWVRAVAFTASGMLASADIGGTLRLWDARRQRPLGPPASHLGEILGLAASPDGNTLAIAGADGLLRLWDLHRRRPLGGPLTGHTGNVDAVAVSPDGHTLASGGEDGTVRLWDAHRARSTGPPLDPRAGPIRSVAFSKTRILAAGADDGTVRLWDLTDLTHRRPLPPLRSATRFVRAVAFTPDGRTLASAANDNQIWLWDVDTRRPLGRPLTGHTDIISALAFSRDGTTLASAGADHTIRLWDVPTHHALGQPLSDRTGWVTTLAFDPRGTQLASAGEDGTIRLWDPLLWSHDRHALLRRICPLIRSNLTRTEWDQYLPGQIYHDTCPPSP